MTVGQFRSGGSASRCAKHAGVQTRSGIGDGVQFEARPTKPPAASGQPGPRFFYECFARNQPHCRDSLGAFHDIEACSIMGRLCHDDQSLYYLLRGHGDPLLLIHGLGSSGADWAMQVAALEGRFRLIVPDLPGCGHSGLLPVECSIAGFAKSLWALLDHLEIERPNIIGFSPGGAVALEMALQRPNLVPRLALINSLASYRIDHWRKWLEARGSSALVSLFGMRFAGRLFAARLFPHPRQRPIGLAG